MGARFSLAYPHLDSLYKTSYNRDMSSKTTFKCDNCGIYYQQYASLSTGKKHYCSKSCNNEGKLTHIYQCIECGKIYHRPVRKNQKPQFCSTACRTANRRKNPKALNCKCQYCKKLFHKIPYAIEHGEGKYCSWECKKLGSRGTHTFGKEVHYYSKASWREIREAVLKRDNYICLRCGKKDSRPSVHHLVRRRLGGKDELENLVTLCRSCHAIEDAKQLNDLGLKRIKH